MSVSGDDDTEMRDGAAVQEEEAQYGAGLTEELLDEKYPNRPHNHRKTLPFSELYLRLFNPLDANKRRKGKSKVILNRKKLGPHGPTNLNPNDVRKNIIAQFITRWRKEVGDDIYPAFRLIVPEKDRDRAMYGLKEKTIGKLLVRTMKIDKDSEDGYNLLNWKLPGVKAASAMAGDFAGRCYEVISKRPMRTEPGDLSIGEVNEMLDRLSAAQKEENQLPIFQDFYKRMNAEEMMWLIRIMLRQMKIGATEKTLFDIWHRDAENLFNVSSSLRRVCWELYDPSVSLEGDSRDIKLMECFQPQLAAFQMRSLEKVVDRMNLTDDDPVFWIEEKLDGERMQLHMQEDDSTSGGYRFCFWSRKGKDYTYLYGNGYHDSVQSSLTTHIRSAFNPGVRNIILDGEMITWDSRTDGIHPFGNLKTAAISQQQNPFADGLRPLFKVFDCLYLNDNVLTRFTLRDRRRALAQSVNNVHRRLEVHEYLEAKTPREIETELQKVVAEKSEGLVVKRPGSTYCLNQRNEDWIKVKPEYMAEFGESLDCIVVGGYYGSGKRGGAVSSFLCGLRLSDEQLAQYKCNPMMTYSFFKVGGGFRAEDYADIRHRTDGKWHTWDKDNPPSNWIELGGHGKQFERPDVWIKPEDSVVLEVKAASVTESPQFRYGYTLRFPRFKKLRSDKTWKDALSTYGFEELKRNAEKERENKKFRIDDARRQRNAVRSKKRKLTVLGAEQVSIPYTGPATKIFEGLTFYIITGAAKPIDKTKAEIEQIVKLNGGNITQTQRDENTICVAEGNQIRVASIKKEGKRNIFRPKWILDAVVQSDKDADRPALLLPYEPQHVLFAKESNGESESHLFEQNVDSYGDSYARDVTVDELDQILNAIPKLESHDDMSTETLLETLSVVDMTGWMFRGVTAYLVMSSENVIADEEDADLEAIGRKLHFAGGLIAGSLDDSGITHVIVGRQKRDFKDLRRKLSRLAPTPRLVTSTWVTESWSEGTRLDEEGFHPN